MDLRQVDGCLMYSLLSVVASVTSYKVQNVTVPPPTSLAPTTPPVLTCVSCKYGVDYGRTQGSPACMDPLDTTSLEKATAMRVTSDGVHYDAAKSEDVMNKEIKVVECAGGFCRKIWLHLSDESYYVSRRCVHHCHNLTYDLGPHTKDRHESCCRTPLCNSGHPVLPIDSWGLRLCFVVLWVKRLMG